jgi:GH35 family endo-1,4-beta-xylanase
MNHKLEDLARTIDKFRALGVDVLITELDVNMHNIPQEQRVLLKARIYRMILETSVSHGITDITIFGVQNKNTWLSTTYGLTDSEPLLFNDFGQPEIAYFAALNSLLGD